MNDFTNNPIPTIQEEVIALREENAELLESCRDKDRQLNKWFISYNKVIKKNEQLNRDKTELVNSVTELKTKVTELEKQIEKMKNCYNCKHNNEQDTEFCCNCDRQYEGEAIKDEWESAE